LGLVERKPLFWHECPAHIRNLKLKNSQAYRTMFENYEVFRRTNRRARYTAVSHKKNYLLIYII
jgi:hypothetical protein